MPNLIHIFECLERDAPVSTQVCVLFGDDPFLKQLGKDYLSRRLLSIGSDDAAPAVFPGETVRWRDVHDELSTVSLFGGSGTKRVAIIEQADKFVSDHRSELEAYVSQPSRIGVLVLEVESWPANTKLYKLIDQLGLPIDCNSPTIPKSRNKDPDLARIKPWLIAWAKSKHNLVLESKAAQLLVEFTGAVFGMLDQDLAKLALYVPPGGKITPEMVRDIVGGWRTNTAFELVDAAASGHADEALRQLDRLLQSGDHPLAIFGPIAWSLRRYNAAMRSHEAAERQGKRPPLRESLQAAGFNDWPKGSLEAAEKRLKHLTRERAGKLYRWLLEIDLALKGSHSQADRARFALEHLILKMAANTGSAASK